MQTFVNNSVALERDPGKRLCLNEPGDHKTLAIRNYIQPKIGNYIPNAS